MPDSSPATNSLRPSYAVVSPVGETAAKGLRLAPQLADLTGKTVGLVWIRYINGDVLADALIDLLSRRFEGLRCAKLPPGKGLGWGDYPETSIGEVVKEAGVDAAIVLIGC